MTPLITLEDVWRIAAKDIGLDIVIPFKLTLPSGRQVNARCVVRNFGAPKGMLLVQHYSDVADVTSELVEYGYGYSVMDDPLPGHGYNRDDIVRVLRDWGWCGPMNAAPHWAT